MSTAAISHSRRHPAVWKPSHNPWAVALTVTLATFMEVLDTSIANVALPHMAGTPRRQPGRSHLGPHQLPRLERHRAAHLRLALRLASDASAST